MNQKDQELLDRLNNPESCSNEDILEAADRIKYLIEVIVVAERLAKGEDLLRPQPHHYLWIWICGARNTMKDWGARIREMDEKKQRMSSKIFKDLEANRKEIHKSSRRMKAEYSLEARKQRYRQKRWWLWPIYFICSLHTSV